LRACVCVYVCVRLYVFACAFFVCACMFGAEEACLPWSHRAVFTMRSDVKVDGATPWKKGAGRGSTSASFSLCYWMLFGIHVDCLALYRM
jgi:hypothetical protein